MNGGETTRPGVIWHVVTGLVTALLVCLLVPSVAAADLFDDGVSPEDATHIELVSERRFNWKVVYPEHVDESDETAERAGLEGLTRANVGISAGGTPLVVWESLDDFVIDLANGVALPLFVGINGTPLVDVFTPVEPGPGLEEQPVEYGLWFDQTLDRELDISRLIDESAPDPPLMVPLFSLRF